MGRSTSSPRVSGFLIKLTNRLRCSSSSTASGQFTSPRHCKLFFVVVQMYQSKSYCSNIVLSYHLNPQQLIQAAQTSMAVDAIRHYNIAVCGQSGAAKSTFINRIRGLKNDSAPGAAREGETETTKGAMKYPYRDYPYIMLWDMPGGGTVAHPSGSYFRDKNLVVFDFILIVTSNRFHEVDMEIAKAASATGRPCAFVWTKADESIASRARSQGKTMLDASKRFSKKVKESFREQLRMCNLCSCDVELLILSALAFTKVGAYHLYDSETGEVDRTLSAMDEGKFYERVAAWLQKRQFGAEPSH